jgi:hypothetical protein
MVVLTLGTQSIRIQGNSINRFENTGVKLPTVRRHEPRPTYDLPRT